MYVFFFIIISNFKIYLVDNKNKIEVSKV